LVTVGDVRTPRFSFANREGCVGLYLAQSGATRSAFRNDGNKFYKTHRILVLIDDGDQSSSFVRDIAFSLAA
jgi:hypothetical protein